MCDDRSVWVIFDEFIYFVISLMGFAKKNKFKKSEFIMEVGGWVQVSLGFFFLNHHKIALNQY